MAVGRVRSTLGKLSWAPGREHVPVLEPSVAGESPWLNWERDHYVTKSLRPAVPPSALDLGAEALEAPAPLGGRQLGQVVASLCLSSPRKWEGQAR